jgi:hypothetical protein
MRALTLAFVFPLIIKVIVHIQIRLFCIKPSLEIKEVLKLMLKYQLKIRLPVQIIPMPMIFFQSFDVFLFLFTFNMTRLCLENRV